MIESFLNQAGEWFSNGVEWLVTGGIGALLDGIGNLSRFMVNEVNGTFLIFGMVGVFIYISGNTETGIKMVNKSILWFFICMVIGAVL